MKTYILILAAVALFINSPVTAQENDSEPADIYSCNTNADCKKFDYCLDGCHLDTHKCVNKKCTLAKVVHCCEKANVYCHTDYETNQDECYLRSVPRRGPKKGVVSHEIIGNPYLDWKGN